MTKNDNLLSKGIKGTVWSNEGFCVVDPCYVLGEDIYTDFWGAEKNYANGVFEVNGFNFAVGATRYGDGVYFDENADKYPVDSGTIALIPLELVEKKDGLTMGFLLKRPGEADFRYNGGVFEIMLPDDYEVKIDTTYDYECDDYGRFYDSDDDDEDFEDSEDFENEYDYDDYDDDDDEYRDDFDDDDDCDDYDYDRAYDVVRKYFSSDDDVED